MNLCPATFRSFVVHWSAKIAGRWSQLKPLCIVMCMLSHENLRKGPDIETYLTTVQGKKEC